MPKLSQDSSPLPEEKSSGEGCLSGSKTTTQLIPVPTFTNGLQLIGFIAILVYMAYGQWLGRENAKTVKRDVKIAAETTRAHLEEAAGLVSQKADLVHDLVNGQNAEFKRLLSEKTHSDAQIHQQIAESAANKATIELRESFLKRIQSLEEIIASQQKTIQQAGPMIAPITPEKRLEEIRGQE